MKICHLTSVHQRYDTRIFLKECRSLQKAGFDVSLIVADGKGDEIKDEIKIYDVGKPHSRLKRMLKTTKKIYQKAVEINAEIYHFHDPELIPIGLKLKRLGKKVIYDVHEDVPRQILSKPYLSSIIARPLSFFFKLYEHYAVKRFSAIITVTNSVKFRLEKINPNIIIVSNYPILKELYNNVKWENRKNEICYVGGITEIRGIKQVLKALEQTETILHLAGNFENQNLEEYCKSLPAWNKVKYYGFLNREEVKNLLSNVKIGIVTFLPVPNHIEAQPNKMFEYMSAGLAVIASNFPLWNDIILNNNCGITVNPTDPQAIAEAINTLLSDDTRLKQMSENALKSVREKYNWAIEERKLINIYNRLTYEKNTDS